MVESMYMLLQWDEWAEREASAAESIMQGLVIPRMVDGPAFEAYARRVRHYLVAMRELNRIDLDSFLSSCACLAVRIRDGRWLRGQYDSRLAHLCHWFKEWSIKEGIDLRGLDAIDPETSAMASCVYSLGCQVLNDCLVDVIHELDVPGLTRRAEGKGGSFWDLLPDRTTPDDDELPGRPTFQRPSGGAARLF